jgi:thioesterase domain-containing protein
VQPDGPYHLLGWSFGAVVAHAIATRMQEAGDEVALLVSLDGAPPLHVEPEPELTEPERLAQWLSAIGCDGPAPDSEGWDDVLHRLAEAEHPFAPLGQASVQALFRVFHHNVRLLRAYQPRACFQGDLLHFVSAENRDPTSPKARAWDPHISRSIIRHELDCVHAAMTQPAPMSEVGRIISDRFQASPRPSPKPTK